jgi:uncharacterized membrane protein YraQ (UPF0718 family)
MNGFEFVQDRGWWARVLGDAFSPVFWTYFAAMLVLGAISATYLGVDAFWRALAHDTALLLALLPRVLVAMAIAALIWALLPHQRVAEMLGKDTGLWGLVLAALAGAVTPGGPASAYALLAMLGAAGAERGALVAYIGGWALLSLQRVLIWDVPFLGVEFALLTLLACLPLPIIAGAVARKLPVRLHLRGPAQHQPPAPPTAPPTPPPTVPPTAPPGGMP